MRRPNLQIIGVDKSEDFQLKGPVNIFNKIIEENFPNLNNDMPMNIQEAYRIPNRLDEKRNSSRSIRITPDFSPETMKARRSWADLIQIVREHKC